MTHLRSILSRTSLGFLTGCLCLIGSISAAEISPDILEEELVSLQDQWAENQREFAKAQEFLHRKANNVRSSLCKAGRNQYCPGVDLRKLAHAVAVAETSGCTAGVGVSKNNCHGITECSASGCRFKTFATTEESYVAFERIWLNGYGNRFPTIEDAIRYTDNPEPHRWYNVVTTIYNSR